MKPFNLEEYKKDPNRLCQKRKDWCEIEKSQLVFDEAIAIKLSNGNSFLVDLKNASLTLALSTKYEVRRARPWYGMDGKQYWVIDSDKYSLKPKGYPWSGPEFEYKVEV
jgi:hypothetical protein